MSKQTSFQQKVEVTTGLLPGAYLWSNAANWTNGIPVGGDTVTEGAYGFDDIAGLSLASLTLTAGAVVEVIASTLTVSTVAESGYGELLVYTVATGTPVTVAVVSATGSGAGDAYYVAAGTGATLVDQSATDPAASYYASGGGLIELSAPPASTSSLRFGDTATFALLHPAATDSVALQDVNQGDILEVPGSSVTGVSFGANSFSVTTDQGTYSFSNVAYSDDNGTVAGYTAARDSSTGLEAITFAGVDTFEQMTTVTTGPLTGQYLWSNADNWTNGVPVDGIDAVCAATGYYGDDIPALNLASLTLTGYADTFVTGAVLTIGVLTATDGIVLIADAQDAGAAVTVTVDAVTDAYDKFGADGSGARFLDQSPTDSGELYVAQDGGLVALSTPADSSGLEYEGDAIIALQAPAATNAVLVEGVDVGDVLELPGSSVSDFSIGASSFSINTNIGTYAFINVRYNTAGLITGITAAPDTTTGLEAITFIACYRQGTRIATPAAEMPVEHLAVGDVVQTRFAGPVPVSWIGHRHVDCRRHPTPREVWPVRVCVGAFGNGLPHRDLWLSPDHAVFVEGVLIPIKHLINRISIYQTPVDKVTYYHIELPCHDVLMAEGLSAESYLDTGNRSNFANGGRAIALHPEFLSWTWEASGCAPLIITGPRLEAVRRRVNILAGNMSTKLGAADVRSTHAAPTATWR